MAGVNRWNFKRLRKENGIKLKDISAECGLSVACINMFENSEGKYTDVNARDDNAHLMCRTLMRMIAQINVEKENKELMDISKNLEVDEVKVIPVVKAREKLMETGISRVIFATIIRNYCAKNNVGFGEFCKMCGIAASTISEAEIKKHPVVYDKTVQKVLKATGWTMDIFTGKEEDKSMNTSLEASKKADEHSGRFAWGSCQDSVKTNLSYVFSDGKYYMTYDEVKHVTKEISREEFLKGV